MRAVLARVAEAEPAERRAGLTKLELACSGACCTRPPAETGAAVWGDAGLPGLTGCEESLGGAGCPTVAAFAPEPFAAALGVSTSAGMQLLADALDLAYRLPRPGGRPHPGGAAWKARRLAQATHHLSPEAAATSTPSSRTGSTPAGPR